MSGGQLKVHEIKQYKALNIYCRQEKLQVLIFVSANMADKLVLQFHDVKGLANAPPSGIKAAETSDNCLT